MSGGRIHRSGGTYFKRGSWNAWCQRCGAKYKSEDLCEEWDGLKVCHDCWELRHPQDLVQGILDEQAVPWASPELADTFVNNAATQGLTTAPFAAGPDYEIFDTVNTLSVQVSGQPLASVQMTDVLGGANMCAVQNPAGGWEILQFTTAALTAPMQYTLSGLLRAREGTENAMQAVLPAGAPFVFIGQASAATYAWIQTYLGIGTQPFSPCDITATASGQDIVFSWNRRSKAVRIDEDDWDVITVMPMGESEERYEVDVLNFAGTVLRTLAVTAATRIVYPYAMQLADFGAAATAGARPRSGRS
jgi:hypothetical protein